MPGWDAGARRAAIGVLWLACAAPAGAGSDALYAERIDVDNARRRQVGGSGARGGIGDWAFGNGTLCGVVSDAEHESPLSPHGGVLIDLANCGREDDQFNVLQPMVNLRRGVGPPVEAIRTEVEARAAHVVVERAENGVRFETRFTAGLDRPSALRIETRMTRVAEGERFNSYGEIALHPNGSLRVFTHHLEHPALSPGFVHAAAEGQSIRAMVRAMRTADLHVLVGSDPLAPIAYGLQDVGARLERADGTVQDLPHFSLNGVDFTMRGFFARPFWFGRESAVGFRELAQTPFMDLAPGERMSVARIVWVGERADVASITDQIHAGGRRVSGQLDDPEGRLHVDLRGGGAVTQARPRPDGSFAFRLPPGEYTLRAVAPAGRALERAFAVGTGDVALGRLAVGRPARIALPRGAPMRLVFEGVDGTPDPRLGDDLLGVSVGGEEVPSSLLGRDVSLAGRPGDPASVVLAPGRYRVHATRGPEFGVTRAELTVAPGASGALEIEPPARALATPGWISADMHVHAAGSFDSGMPWRERLRSFAAQGAEVLVSTEHDNVFDYAPLIRELGLAGEVASVAGSEVTSSAHSEATPHTFGHANAFPLPLRPDRYRGGALRSEGVRLRAPIAELRALGGARVFQLNHPRRATGERHDGAFFSHLSVAGAPFDPALPLDREPNRALLERDPESGLRDLDFDAMELLNGPSLDYYRLVRADWFSLLLQGERRAATANSDSHHQGQVVALPRTYVRVPDDRVAAFDEAAFTAAVRAGHAFGTTGPLLDVRLGQAGIGERFRGPRGVLRVTARAAPWVPLSRCRVYVNARLVAERPIAPDEPLELDLEFAGDSFVTVEVEGEADAVYAAVAPDATPFAYTNPLWVDADGDGAWTAPGLPAELPDSIARPLR